MNAFRAGVLYRRPGTSRGQLADRVAKFEGLARGAAVWRYRFPQDDPVVFLYLARAQRPALGLHVAEDGSFLVIDGEVFNLSDLSGAAGAHGDPPARVLFNLYRAHGEGVFARMDAAATIMVWDSRDGRLVVARDRWGVVPSFFTEDGGILCWSTDVPSLLQVSGYRGINLAALDYFLGTGHCPAPWTIADGIAKLPPAHLLTAGPNEPKGVRRYWRPTGRPELRLDADDATERFASLLRRSLQRQIRDDEEIGVMLSAGVDSKLLAGALKDLGRPFRTFTFRYADYEGEFNEAGEASKTARHLGVPFEEIVYTPDDIPENLEWMVRSYGEPFGHGLHSSMIGRIESQRPMALLNGAAPDSWYPYKWDRLSLPYSALPKPIQLLGVHSIPFLLRLGAARRPAALQALYSRAGRLAHGAQIVTWGAGRRISPRFMGIWNPMPYRAGLFRGPSWLTEARERIDSLLAEARKDFQGENARDTLIFHFRQFFPAEGTLYWNHWWGRAAGLQVRFPYLDADLDDFVMRLPRRGKDKDDVRRLAERYVGRDLAYFPKLGQTVPIEHWFRNQLKDFLVDHLSPERIEQSGVFDAKTILGMVDRHIRGEANYAFRLWPIITVLKWQELASSGRWQTTGAEAASPAPAVGDVGGPPGR